ncbi:MAG TPA: methylenetetrahydrofolate reductase [NAD(P)H] [Capsulimonadaceae bacterium]|jgi:methylenetetrahydrofolate reductase (NADPH)
MSASATLRYYDKLKVGEPTISFEIFPPKNPAGWSSLYATLAELSKRSPDFISVTYGAGGSTREKTVDLVGRIRRELNIPTIAHLTCVGHSTNELGDILRLLEAAEIDGVMALRGDPPKGAAGFTAHPEGFQYASELISFAHHGFAFHIGCGFYPEKHPEAESLDADIAALKVKQDAGAEFAVSQLFFDNDTLYRFREKATKAGVTMPLVAGIMPVTGLSQLKRFRELSGTDIPAKLVDFLGAGTDEEITQRGVEYGVTQCVDLLEHGIAGVHLYTLNRSTSTVAITDELRRRGYFPLPSK